MSPRSQLPNSPLVEVVYEVKFPGDFALIDGLARIQNELRVEFPKLLVPNAAPGEAPSLQHYRFASADLQNTVGVALNSIIVSTKCYTVFPAFESLVTRVLEIIHGVHEPPEFRRLGLRFVNLLPLIPGSLEGIHPWLKIGASLPDVVGGKLVEPAQCSFVLERDGGSRLRITCGPAQAAAQSPGGPSIGKYPMAVDGFLLDLDAFVLDATAGEDLAFLPRAHHIIDSTFFGLLSDAGVAALEGRG